jgi:myo-inositol-1(or 4)-monophosphatase
MTSGAEELAVAVAAVEAAGDLLCEHYEQGVRPEWKGDRDPVTAADREAEALIRRHIREAFPDDLVVGEEGAELAEDDVTGRRRWYVDPLDGTTNFLKGRRRWASSVGFCDADDVMRAGAIRLPLWSETYTATAGGGAACNGTPTSANRTSELAEALVLIGALGLDRELERRSLALLGARALSLRVTGSTVADLVDLAVGRADVFWATSPGRWDLAAGLLIASEAGVVATDLEGRPVVATAPTVVAAVPEVHAEVLRIVAP